MREKVLLQPLYPVRGVNQRLNSFKILRHSRLPQSPSHIHRVIIMRRDVIDQAETMEW